MLHVTEDIHPLTDFKRRTPEFLDRLRKLGRPLVLTVNGKAEAVVLTPQVFDRLWQLADFGEAVQGIRRGLDEADAGKGIPIDEALQQLRRKHGLPDRDRADGTTGD
jgi:prevent-host-death family protein